MKGKIRTILSFVLMINLAFAQEPLLEVEKTLASYADQVFNGESLELKKAQNKKFARLLIETLKRPESYSYPFDSLKTISILRADDNEFRIFTWQIENKKDPGSYYGQTSHYYFGLVQRKYENENGETEYIVIPLLEMPEIPRGVENMILDNTNWLGGLYYPPKYGESIPSKTLKYYDPKERTKSGKIKRTKQKYYILLGWNGMDHTSNLKYVDVMAFDPNDKNRVTFGINVFYFDKVFAKHRALFKYSEYAPFSLNYSFIESGPFNLFSKKVLVYDHLASPKPGQQKLKEIWEMGPDGSYDALEFKKGGYFEWRKNVTVMSKTSTRELKAAEENQQKILRARLAEVKKVAILMENDDLVAEIEELEKKKSLGKKTAKLINQQEKRLAKRQEEIRKAEEKKLQDAGIDLSEE